MRKRRTTEGYSVDSLRRGLMITLLAAALAYGVQLRDPFGPGLFLVLLLLPRNSGLYVSIRRMNPTVGAGLLGLSLLLPIPDFLYVSGNWTMAFAHLAMFLAAWKVQHRRLTTADAWFLFALAFFIALMSTGGVQDPFFAPLLAVYAVISIVMLTVMCLTLEEQRVLDLARVRSFERPDAGEVAGKKEAPRRAVVASLRYLSFVLIATGSLIWWATPHVISGVGGAIDFILHGDREEVVDALPEVEDDELRFEIPDGVVALPPFGARLERDEFVRRRETDHLVLLVRPAPLLGGFTRSVRVRGECYDYLTQEGRWIRSRASLRTIFDGEDGTTDGKVALWAGLPGLGGGVPGVAAELEYLIPPGRDHTLYVSPVPIRVDQPQIVTDGTRNLRFAEALAVPRNYTALSSIHEPAVPSTLSDPGPEFLLLPAGTDPVAFDGILSPLTGHLTNPLHRVQAVLTWLRRRHIRLEADERAVGPSAEIQKAPTDVDVNGFLFERKWGRDIDFASAAILLLRADGIPCRLATGYADGAFLDEPGFFVFRTGDLSAWVEVPFEGLGWVPFESSPMDVDELDPDVVDEIFEAPEEERADEALAALEEEQKPSLLAVVLEAIDKFVSGLVPGGGASTAAGRLLAWLIVLCGLGLIAWLLSRLSSRVSTFVRLQRDERHRVSPRFPFYDRLLRVLARYGFRRQRAETPLEFAHAVAQATGDRAMAEVIGLTKIFCALRYGEKPVAESQAMALVARVDRVEHALAARAAAEPASGPGILSLLVLLGVGLLVGPAIAQVEAEVDVERAAQELGSRVPGTRRSAMYSLIGLGGESIPVLLALFDEPRVVDRQEEIGRLIELLDAPDYRKREDAAKRLAEIGAPAGPALREVLSSGSPEARHRAKALLEGIQPIPESKRAEEKRDRRMRRIMALRVLGRIGDAPEVEPLALVAELHPALRTEVARALAAIGVRRPRELLLPVDRERPELRRLAALALGFWPPEERQPHLLRLVADSDEETRRIARRGLVTARVIELTDAARLALGAGENVAADTRAREALSLCPGYAEAGLILLEILIQRKRYGEAVHLARGLDMPDPDRHLATAKPLYLSGRPAEALQELALAYQARPGFTVALLEAARIHLDKGKDGAGPAMLLIDRAIVSSRFDAAPWALRGFVLEVHLKDLAKAESAYRIALSQDPGNPQYEKALRRLESRPR